MRNFCNCCGLAGAAGIHGGRAQGKFIVADYEQLELRLLAHMADCKSMKEAFSFGGDLHSRTAFEIFDSFKEAVRDGMRRCSV